MNALFDAPMNLYAAQLNAAKRVVDACVAGTERLDRIVLEAAKDVLHTEIENAKAVAQCRTPQEFWSLAQTHGRSSYERIVARNTDMLREFAEFGTHAFNAAQGIAAQAQAEGSAAMRATGAIGPTKVAEPFAQMMEMWQASSRRMFAAMQPPAPPAGKPASSGRSRAS